MRLGSGGSYSVGGLELRRGRHGRQPLAGEAGVDRQEVVGGAGEARRLPGAILRDAAPKEETNRCVRITETVCRTRTSPRASLGMRARPGPFCARPWLEQ